MPLPYIEINGRRIGPGYPAYVVAEISCNHLGRFDRAVAIIKAAKDAGADAVKLQTYTPQTITLDSNAPPFNITQGNAWAGRTLYNLYEEAMTPWEWQPRLKQVAKDVGIDLFSSPFDPSAVEFLERMELPAYKVASFELVDLPLIQRIAKTQKPVLLSTGLATLVEILEAVEAAREAGATQIAVLKCTSEYPAKPSSMNLSAIPHLATTLQLPIGLSDHTLAPEVAQAAVALGACIIEKHLTLARADGGPDAGFSLEPQGLQALVRSIRIIEQAMGRPDYQLTTRESANRCFRRSLFVVADVKAGEQLTERNVRSIRPADGLPPKFLPFVLGKYAARDISRGTPLRWELVITDIPQGVSNAATRSGCHSNSR